MPFLMIADAVIGHQKSERWLAEKEEQRIERESSMRRKLPKTRRPRLSRQEQIDYEVVASFHDSHLLKTYEHSKMPISEYRSPEDSKVIRSEIVSRGLI